VVIAAGVVLAVCLLLGGGLAWFATSTFNRFDRVDVDLQEVTKGEPENFLLVGSDSRDSITGQEADAGAFLDGETAGRRSDTVMVARVDPRSQRIGLLSIPRDLWVVVGAGGEEDRINTAYAEGPQILVDTVTNALGIPIHHYVEVDFGGFKGLVDVLGGVPMYFDQPMRDEWTGLHVAEAGCVELSGDQALAFARSRNVEVFDGSEWVADPTADLGRITRQQLFLRKAMDQARGLGLTDLPKVKRLADVATENVSFDPGLSLGRALALVRRFGASGGEAMITYSLPTEPFTTWDGASVLQLQEEAAQPTLDVFRGRVPLPGTEPAAEASTNSSITPAAVSVSVLNGTGIDGQASEAAGMLQSSGFAVAEVGDAGTIDQAHTVLRYQPGQRVAAELVAGRLRGAPELTEDRDAAAPVVLVTGADFRGVVAGTGAADEGAASTTAATAEGTGSPAPAEESTTTTYIGFAPGEAPPGTTCG
jgi:LCP family protein required for cell wall assembly